jgi:hypothetical protein
VTPAWPARRVDVILIAEAENVKHAQKLAHQS